MQPIHSGFACFCWAWPLSLLLLRWSLFGRNANLAGGFAGRRLVVFGCFLWFLRFSGLLLVHGHSVMYLFSFYHFYFCQDRASGNIGRTRRKKKTGRRVLFCRFLVDSAFRGLLYVHDHSVVYCFREFCFYFCQDRASSDIGHTRGKKK